MAVLNPAAFLPIFFVHTIDEPHVSGHLGQMMETA